MSRLVHLIVGPGKHLPELLGQDILPKLGLRVPRRPCVQLVSRGVVHSRGLLVPVR